MSWDLFLGAWVAAGLTLFMYSFLYRDNPFFKFGEHLYVGVSMGYTIVRIHYDVMVNKLYAPMVRGGQWWFLVPTVLGLLILTRFIPRLGWLSRIAFAVVVGFGSGVAIPRTISSFILQQVQGTVRPLLAVADGRVLIWSFTNPNALLNVSLILLGVIAVLVYFFFSLEHRGLVHWTARLGIYFLMVSFGAAFGYTVMARMSLLIGRFDDLLLFATRPYAYATPILLLLVAGGLLLWERGRGAAGGGEGGR